MDTTPLPNPDIDPSDSDPEPDPFSDSSSLSDFVVRVTPHDKFTFQEIYDMLMQEPLLFRFVIGRETTPREHFHIVLSVDSSVTEQEVRDIIKAFLQPYWENPDTHKLPRGFGNKQYNLQSTTRLDAAVSYAIKFAEYKVEGFDPEYITQRLTESFKPNRTTTFRLEYLELCKTFQETSMHIEEFMVAFCDLKAKYNQQVILSQAYAYALGQEIRRDKTAQLHVDNFLYNR